MNLHSTLIKYKVPSYMASSSDDINLHSTLIKYKDSKEEYPQEYFDIYIPL